MHLRFSEKPNEHRNFSHKLHLSDSELGHAYHVGTECMFWCDGEALGVIWCNQLGRWKPQKPEEFSCSTSTQATTLNTSTEASTITMHPPTPTMTTMTTPQTPTTTQTTANPTTVTTTQTTTPSTTTHHPVTSTHSSTEPGPDPCDTHHWLPEAGVNT